MYPCRSRRQRAGNPRLENNVVRISEGKVKRSFQRALTAYLTVCSLTSCMQDGGVERWQGLVADLRYVWTAEPGIDVLTGPAVPVRAFVESFMLSQYAGDMAYAYPGFDRAVPEADSELWTTRPALDVPSKEPAIGHIRYHILSVDGTGEQLTATVCGYNYRVAAKQDDGSYRSVARVGLRDTRGIFAFRVGLTGSSGSTPPQSGPRPDPIDDVFGDWRVHGMLDSYSSDEPGFAEAWPTYEADRQTCIDRAPDPAPERARIIDGTFPRSEFPTLPASPGWPEGRSE